jgi:hypothetical protein
MSEGTIRKLQIRLLPLLFALYVVAFIDRINLGFAALTMNRELGITSQQFGFAAGVFFWGPLRQPIRSTRSRNPATILSMHYTHLAARLRTRKGPLRAPPQNEKADSWGSGGFYSWGFADCGGVNRCRRFLRATDPPRAFFLKVSRFSRAAPGVSLRSGLNAAPGVR